MEGGVNFFFIKKTINFRLYCKGSNKKSFFLGGPFTQRKREREGGGSRDHYLCLGYKNKMERGG